MNTETTTETLVEYPSAFSGRLTRSQARALHNERHAYDIAANLGDVTTARMDQARKALRRVIRAGNLSVRLMEAENDSDNYDNGAERIGLRILRRNADRADQLAREALRPFGLRLTYPGPYPLIQRADGTGSQIMPEY